MNTQANLFAVMKKAYRLCTDISACSTNMWPWQMQGKKNIPR